MWSGAEVHTVGGAIRVLGAFAGSVPSPRQFSIARQVGAWDRRGADSADRDASIRRVLHHKHGTGGMSGLCRGHVDGVP